MSALTGKGATADAPRRRPNMLDVDDLQQGSDEGGSSSGGNVNMPSQGRVDTGGDISPSSFQRRLAAASPGGEVINAGTDLGKAPIARTSLPAGSTNVGQQRSVTSGGSDIELMPGETIDAAGNRRPALLAHSTQSPGPASTGSPKLESASEELPAAGHPLTQYAARSPIADPYSSAHKDAFLPRKASPGGLQQAPAESFVAPNTTTQAAGHDNAVELTSGAGAAGRWSTTSVKSEPLSSQEATATTTIRQSPLIKAETTVTTTEMPAPPAPTLLSTTTTELPAAPASPIKSEPGLVVREEVRVPHSELKVPAHLVKAPSQEVVIPPQEVVIPEHEVSAPAKTVTVPEHQVTSEEQPVLVPSQTITVPEKEIFVPAKEVSVPQREVIAPAQKVVVPAHTVMAPAQRIVVPAHEVTVPEHMTTAPEQTVTVPEHEVVAPAQTVVVPEQRLTVPATEIKAPEQQVVVPEQRVEVPEQEVAAPQQEIVVPQEEVEVAAAPVELPRNSTVVVPAPPPAVVLPEEQVIIKEMAPDEPGALEATKITTAPIPEVPASEEIVTTTVPAPQLTVVEPAAPAPAALPLQQETIIESSAPAAAAMPLQRETIIESTAPVETVISTADVPSSAGEFSSTSAESKEAKTHESLKHALHDDRLGKFHHSDSEDDVSALTKNKEEKSKSPTVYATAEHPADRDLERKSPVKKEKPTYDIQVGSGLTKQPIFKGDFEVRKPVKVVEESKETKPARSHNTKQFDV